MAKGNQYINKSIVNSSPCQVDIKIHVGYLPGKGFCCKSDNSLQTVELASSGHQLFTSQLIIKVNYTHKIVYHCIEILLRS